jgi:hypothetical protein
MYNRPTQEHSTNALLDVVVDDHAVRSPLDAVAAWRSTQSLTQALDLSMKVPGASELVQEHLTQALRLAPPGSAAEARALAASSVFATTGRNSYLVRASKVMELSSPLEAQLQTGSRPPYFIDSSTPVSAREDIMNCLHCAKALQILDHERDGSKAADFFSSQSIDATKTNLLTQAAMKHLLWRLPVAAPSMFPGEEVRTLSYGMNSAADIQGSMEKTSRRHSSASHDTGYESQDDSISSWGLDHDSRYGETISPAYSSKFVI